MQQQRAALMTENKKAAVAATETALPAFSSQLMTFALYLDARFPVVPPLTVTQGLQVLSGFTGASEQQLKAALQIGPPSDSTNSLWASTHYVPNTMLYCWLRQLTRAQPATDAAAEAETWWTAPGVRVFDTPIEEENGDEQKNHFSPPRSNPPPRHVSPLPQATGSNNIFAEALSQPVRDRGIGLHASDEGRSTATTNTAWTTSCTRPAASIHPSQRVAPSLEHVAAAALSALGLLKNQKCPEDNLPPPTDRSQKPLPVPPSVDGVALRATARPFTPPPPLFVTLAELENLVHRRKEVKVCRQFMQTGACSYGARCLYHHPASAASSQRERFDHMHSIFPSPAFEEGRFAMRNTEDQARSSQRRNTLAAAPLRRAPLYGTVPPNHPLAAAWHDSTYNRCTSGVNNSPSFAHNELINAANRHPETFGQTEEQGSAHPKT